MMDTVVVQDIDVTSAREEATSTTVAQNFTGAVNRKNLPNERGEHLMFGSEKNPNSFPDGGTKANLVLLGSFIGLIADFGIPTSMGALESYVSLHQLSDQKQTTVSWIFSLHLGVMFFCGVFFGEFFDKYGSRKPLMISTICMTIGLVLTAQSTALWHFILSYSILTAVGTSMGMVPLIGSLSHWFLKKRGVACSIGTIGGLIGGAVFPIMLQTLYTQVGFQWAVRILALICCICMSISIFLVKERVDKTSTADFELTNDETDQFVELADISSTRNQENILNSCYKFLHNCLDLSLVKDSRFVFLTLAVAGAELISLTTLTFITSYALNVGVSNSQAYLLITVINVTGIPSRLISGYLADKYGRFNVMIVTSAMTTIVIFALWLPAKSDVSTLFAFAALFGVSTSAVISLIPACTGQICSVDKFGKVYGTLYFFLCFLTILGMLIASLVINRGTYIDYRNFILYQGSLSFGSVLLWLVARYTAVGWRWCKF